MPSQPIPIGQDATAPRNAPGAGLSQSAGGLFGKWNAFSMNSTKASPPKDSFDAHAADSFGDIGDLRERGWAAAQHGGARRAMSMSMSPTAVSGFTPMSPPQATALRDNLARGEGALRRLSLGGFGRPTPMPTQAAQPSAPNPPPVHAAPPSQPMLAPPAPPADHRRMSQGRRRFSESGARRRGVSPMGERILRDHL
ncbi:hypothetical protein CcaverHIS002_0508440 [Cutaneotrichosporon cavernicola]|uniref:Uncharacterized protein n=1 Tax=Cutaneotrichosporon cavernicola TaxID=279322 RepID=A0AA48QXE3_9TREE|nr:uncharacterized protein CcaverHIS019_0509010 [Cutaneotrichosporon cavernicola]BEI85443.1 hypothetical protein CcaverHIS002_0508440 [Cutaneotrichosporon cavernicola]BEI93273.1 hypothetical protein CcaverHIS019_0509010 [Cutaneotrichosporon cavernicola]BEJ01051.1 hypothetical protein CcaverHIS631_0509080 [Cutaneotrichosporon cavernicola]BEJ08818.1 hypothetical protein CcaverHIS641_0509120 [Cutaneotrichosporon cavernicola]